MTLKSIQRYTKSKNLFYPPDPNENSAFIGGNFMTNASGPRSFKFGVTRDWIISARVVLPDGTPLSLSKSNGKLTDKIRIKTNKEDYELNFPDYELPKTRKNVAGPVIKSGDYLLDFFIGSDGIFGIVTEIEIKLIKTQDSIISIMVCSNNNDKGLKIIQNAIKQRELQKKPIPLSIELLDRNAIKLIRNETKQIPENSSILIFLEQDSTSEDYINDISYWNRLFDELEIEFTSVAQSPKEIEFHKKLRHLVPKFSNQISKAHGQPKLGTDYAVPVEKLEELLKYATALGNEFQEFQSQILNRSKKIDEKTISYVIWAHAGDAHIHLNFLPRNNEEAKFAKKLMIRFMKQVVDWKGSIAAEHGLGKKKFNRKPALFYQYGEKGIQQILELKRILDPKELLNRGNVTGWKSN